MAHYVLIDANNLAFQSQTAVMDKKSRNKRLFCGEQETTAINGVANAVRQLQSRFRDATLLMLWDSGKAWRYGIYPEYKGTRKTNETLVEAKKALESQRDYIATIMNATGIPQVTAENYEADDIAAFLAHMLSTSSSPHKVTVVTRDQDWLQLVNENVRWYDQFKDRLVTAASFEADIGLASPAQFSEAKILQGDAGDNVSGIKGVGPVAAHKLVQTFGTADAFLAEWTDWVEAGGLEGKHPLNRQRKAIETFLEDAQAARDKLALNRQLMDLRIMYGNKKLLRRLNKTSGKLNRETLKSQFSQLAFLTIINNLEGWLAPFLKHASE